MALVEQKRVDGLVSGVSIATVYYLARRISGHDQAIEAIRTLTAVFAVAGIDQQVVHVGIAMDLKDFEDALQLASAVRAGAECIVTRDERGFAGASIRVCSPADFVRQHTSKH